MQVVILAGGLPSNISDENDRIPKPMVRIGERPLLWHIMKLYSWYGYNDFIVCTGYRGELIKQYFLDYYIYGSDITVDLKKNDVTVHNNITEPWNVTIVHTGLEATTARRIEKILPYIKEDSFIVSYGDCLSNLNVRELVKTHEVSGKWMTVAMARPTGRNEILPLDDSGELMDPTQSSADSVQSGSPDRSRPWDAWVNACNMVVDKRVFDRPARGPERFEIDTLKAMSAISQVKTYKHPGFWLPVETMRDKLYLQSMWDAGTIPWKVWND